MAVIVDPAAYNKCRESGIGNQVQTKLGMRILSEKEEPFTINGKVVAKGEYEDIKGVCVKIAGIDIIITDKRIVLTDPEILRSMGVKLEGYDILVLKSGYVDPTFKPIIEREILALTPGYVSQKFNELTYTKVKQPVFPLNKNIKFDPEEYLLG